MELSVIEADRVIVYLGFFLAAFLVVQTTQQRQRFAEGLAVSLVLVALLGLTSRLLPDLLDIANAVGSGPRMRYPLGYWNANGTVFGIAIAMLLWSSRRSSFAALRWASVAAMPAVLLALYFTYSRGGLLALMVASGCMIVLSRDRLWMLATVGIAAIGALPAIAAVQSRTELADNLAGAGRTDQGVTALLVLLAGAAVAVALFAALRWLERREGSRTGRLVALSRNPSLLRGAAIAIAVIGIGVAIAIGGKAWNQFSSSDIAFPDDPQAHFSELGGAGRHDFWRVAIDAFGEAPVAGDGAGTYVFSWTELRSITLPVHDAHSLYLEAFAELGVIGGLLVLAMVLSLLWFGFQAWHHSPDRERDRNAALLAAMLAFAVGAAWDWFWEIAAMGAIFFLVAGVVVGVRCSQLGGAAAPTRRDGNRRYGLAMLGVAASWIAAAALIGPLLVEREIESSRDAAAAGNYVAAVDHAGTARSIEPWAASPYIQLGLLAEAQGDYVTAIAHYTDAIEREDRTWQWYYLRSKAERAAGDEAAAARDLERARELNPLSACLQAGDCG
ncbi:MAG: O-antigen ligase family protein [Solirubrobacterales bacterium]